MTSSSISVPTGADIKLVVSDTLGGAVIIAPPPQVASLDLLMQPGIAGIFTHDPDVTWPNRSGCAAASAYLAAGHPIALMFESKRDTVACHNRLVREVQNAPR